MRKTILLAIRKSEHRFTERNIRSDTLLLGEHGFTDEVRRSGGRVAKSVAASVLVAPKVKDTGLEVLCELQEAPPAPAAYLSRERGR